MLYKNGVGFFEHLGRVRGSQDVTIDFTSGQLNDALRRAFPSGSEHRVVMCNLHGQDGSVAIEAVEKVVVFLVNVERESVPGSGPPGGSLSRSTVRPEPVHLNLMIMVAANYGGKNYDQALKYLSSAVSFFQGRPVFNHQNTPDLDPRIDKLTMEIENLSIADLSNLWGVLSGKYLPSVLYRMRLLSIDTGQVSAQVPRIAQPEARVGA